MGRYYIFLKKLKMLSIKQLFNTQLPITITCEFKNIRLQNENIFRTTTRRSWW